jgi:putative PIN family toxin of toxin-antitoxin system
VKRVTLDTSEYVSALNGGHRGLRLLHMAIDGEIEIAISEPIVAETIRVLREKFAWPPYDLNDARQRLEKMGRLVEPKEVLAVVADEPDNRILECAAEAEPEYIITEDRALPRLGNHNGARIVKAAEFLEVGGRVDRQLLMQDGAKTRSA